MSIIAARIDNRLLHGIVATQWVPEFRPQRLMVIDDIVANDPTKKAAMRMAKPSGVALSIINKETALTNYQAGKYDDHTVFIVARDPQTILDVIQTGQVVLPAGCSVASAPILSMRPRQMMFSPRCRIGRRSGPRPLWRWA